ncbi:hypothetical protein [uncultured Polaribacter sp.]|uniref:hypothetical protein n=1 Tax=uncultured Polaribacter sp. TaxID=174711 RepID=UPI0026066604|nr:hypothetical protein [uncultured Polaribacter sp.]
MIKYLAQKPFLIGFATVLVLSAILDFVFHVDRLLIRILIIMPFLFILSPRKKKIQTQTGTKIQITWLFLKKPIILDE